MVQLDACVGCFSGLSLLDFLLAGDWIFLAVFGEVSVCRREFSVSSAGESAAAVFDEFVEFVELLAFELDVFDDDGKFALGESGVL